jgi:hypothetical protein
MTTRRAGSSGRRPTTLSTCSWSSVTITPTSAWFQTKASSLAMESWYTATDTPPKHWTASWAA